MSENLKINDCNIYIDNDLAPVERLFESLGQCAVCLLYDVALESVANDVAAKLKREYRVFSYPVSSEQGQACAPCSPPDFVRHIFGIGAGSVARECKALSARLKADWSLLFASPTSDDIMCDNPPKNVFISRNIMLNCPSECLAAGYGILYSEPLKAFEDMFSEKVLAIKKHRSYVLSDADDATDLAVKLLEISAQKGEPDSAELAARLMSAIAKKQGKRPRLMGEYKFLTSSVISEFYSAFLGAPSIDCMPPSSLSASLDTLSYLEAKDIILPKRVDFFNANAYFKISYILGEYRMDLLEKLGGTDSRARRRFWRRLYPDAGYWLKSEVTIDELLRAISLAGAFSDSLLGYAFASGLTARLKAG